MNRPEKSLVLFHVLRYKQGSKENSEFLENEVWFSYPVWEEVCEYTINELERKEGVFNYEEKDVLFTEDCYCFIHAEPIGQSFDLQWCSGIDWELDYIGKDVFEGCEKDLAMIAKKLFDEHDSKIDTFFRHIKPSNELQFITVWGYSSYHDTYNNEYDTDWWLEGLMDLDKYVDLVNKNE